MLFFFSVWYVHYCGTTNFCLNLDLSVHMGFHSKLSTLNPVLQRSYTPQMMNDVIRRLVSNNIVPISQIERYSIVFIYLVFPFSCYKMFSDSEHWQKRWKPSTIIKQRKRWSWKMHRKILKVTRLFSAFSNYFYVSFHFLIPFRYVLSLKIGCRH